MVAVTEKKTSSRSASAAIADISPADLDQMYTETLKNFVEGSIVPGKVLEVRNNEVLVDIGYKSEGSIPANEFSDLAALRPGDSLDVFERMSAQHERFALRISRFGLAAANERYDFHDVTPCQPVLLVIRATNDFLVEHDRHPLGISPQGAQY